MIGLWLQGGELRLAKDLPVPEPPPGEALVRVLQAGICNTDLELIRGYYPYQGILGHEFVGVVARAPARHSELEGRRVVDEITLVGSRCGPFAPALALLERGEVGVDDLITDRYPLTDGLAAFEHAARPEALKVLLRIG